ncbi:MAG: hypothetical protein LC131_07595 [Anaerolineae bacterium]|nr:hypothetical protein [Anaerolineae bacterium]
MNAPARLFQIFRAGSHRAMDGRVLQFTGADIDLMAQAYVLRREPAPLVLGHPRDNLPAYGRVRSLLARHGGLYAFAEVDDDLASWVRAGRYKKVSASFSSPGQADNPTGAWLLRHVGFLGAYPPAVKGMSDPAFAAPAAASFSDADGENACFSAASDEFAAPLGFHVDARRLAIHQRAMSYQAACPALSYPEAVNFAEAI